MLNDWFYSHSTWTVAFAVCSVMIAIPLAGLPVFHRLVDWRSREHDTSMVGLSYALCGGVYAVVMAFMAVGVYESMDRASGFAAAEANSLGGIISDTAGLPEALGAHVRADVNGYLNTVIKKEWPLQQAYQMDAKNFEDGWEQLRRINKEISAIQPATDGQTVVMADMVHLVNELFSARQARLLAASAHLADAIWQMLIVGLVLIVFYLYLFGPHSFKIHVAVTTMTMGTIGLVFSLIIALDYPFRGDLCVSNESYVGVQEIGELAFGRLGGNMQAEEFARPRL